MTKNISILSGLAAFILFINVAQAGYIEVGSFYSSEGHFIYDYARLSVIESFTELGQVTISGGGVALGDVTLHVEKTISNETDFIWTGYIVTLDKNEDPKFVYDSAESSIFGTAEYPDDWTITFSSGQVPKHGELDVEFDIYFSTGSFKFSLTQEPIPEPATLVLLGLGTLVLLTRPRA